MPYFAPDNVVSSCADISIPALTRSSASSFTSRSNWSPLSTGSTCDWANALSSAACAAMRRVFLTGCMSLRRSIRIEGSLSSGDTEFVHLIVDRPLADAKHLGGPGLVALALSNGIEKDQNLVLAHGSTRWKGKQHLSVRDGSFDYVVLRRCLLDGNGSSGRGGSV